jgi:hypothetical protein
MSEPTLTELIRREVLSVVFAVERDICGRPVDPDGLGGAAMEQDSWIVDPKRKGG